VASARQERGSLGLFVVVLAKGSEAAEDVGGAAGTGSMMGFEGAEVVVVVVGASGFW
jgi:hypothetical protein